MKINDLISIAIRNLLSRKLRTMLTVLGVIIGCASIVVMISLGYGITKSNDDFVESLGNVNHITIHGKSSNKTGKEEKLSDKNLNELLKNPKISDGFGLMDFYSGNTYFSVVAEKKYQSHGQVIGIDPEKMGDYGLELVDGTFPKKGDKLVAIYGPYSKRFGYFSGDNYKEKEIDIKTAKIKLVNQSFNPDGTAGEEVSYDLKYGGELVESQNWELSSSIFIPIDDFREILEKEEEKKPVNERDKNIKNKYSKLVLVVDNVDEIKAIKDQLIEDGYQAEAMTDMLESIKEEAMVIQGVFGGIGAVSLLVAAIGISNTMVMSVQERTREIGVMKVIGASLKDIQKLFLFEAALIGAFGGVIGLGLSFGISVILNKVLAPMFSYGGEVQDISIIPITLALVAVVFTSMIGLISGYFPAKNAMKISALDAMRQ